MIDVLPELILFAISAAFTPGPNNIMIMSSGVNFGARASVPHFFGICFGFPTMFLATGFGLGAVFLNYPSLHMTVKIFGLLYLTYLAWQIASNTRVERGERTGQPFTFFQAALFQWVNPKAWIMGTSAIAAFTVVGEPLAPQVLMIGLVFFVMAFPSAGVWLAFGSSLKRLFENVLYLRVFNGVMAVLLLWSMRHTFVEVFVYVRALAGL